MKKIEIQETDIQMLLRCLNAGDEPPAELAKSLFPSLFATWDFKTLRDAKIPTIEYQGKRSEAAILNEASVMGAACPLQLERCFDGGKINKKATQLMLIKESAAEYETNWRNLIVWGDNLQFLKTCYLNQDPIIKDRVKEKVKLVYIDPPFATKSDFAAGQGEDSYADRLDRAEFIEQIRERLLFIRELLHDSGTVYVHLDQRMSAHARVALDEIFGRENFLNEIIWRNTNTHSKASTFGPIHQTILMYSKTGAYRFHKLTRPRFRKYEEGHYRFTDERGQYRHSDLTGDGIRSGESGAQWQGYDPTERGRHWAIPGYVYDLSEDDISSLSLLEKLDYLLDKELIVLPEKRGGQPQIKRYTSEDTGIFLQDIWAYQQYTDGVYAESPECIDEDVSWSVPKSENTGYPTQKPEGLLARIIRSSSDPGDLVMDVFGGSGTTAAVAEKLNRRWIVCDFGKHAIYTMQKRMCLIAESQKLGTKSKKEKSRTYGEQPKRFCVVSVGAFDFCKVMNLRENQDAYISFVMGIFGITQRDDKLAQKYKISNVCALKEGNPVEVYPIWDDEFLKNVRVDMDYLQGILDQSGGKLKGDYYIIAPETCVRVGSETEMKNPKGDRVTFRMLTFPYKVLEEVARHFSIEEQPDSLDKINKLISSVGFYFNEEVRIAVKKSKHGFSITRFSTSILDNQEQRYEGLDGLAMILVDSDYAPERGFTVDTVVYLKDIKEGEVRADGVNGKTAAIAIDKYGNESEITKIGR